MANDEYRTKDIGEGAALLALGIKLLRLDNEKNFFWFVFEDNNTWKISDNYWSGDLKVSAKDYNDSYKTLKDRIFSRQGEPRHSPQLPRQRSDI